MCSDNNGYNCNSSYSTKRAKDEISGLALLILFIGSVVLLCVVVSFLQKMFNGANIFVFGHIQEVISSLLSFIEKFI